MESPALVVRQNKKFEDMNALQKVAGGKGCLSLYQTFEELINEKKNVLINQ